MELLKSYKINQKYAINVKNNFVDYVILRSIKDNVIKIKYNFFRIILTIDNAQIVMQ